MSYVAVFLAMFGLDFIWAKYTFAMAERRHWSAASYASAIIFLSGGAAVGYTSNPWLLLPAMGGAFAGTLMAVRGS